MVTLEPAVMETGTKNEDFNVLYRNPNSNSPRVGVK